MNLMQSIFVFFTIGTLGLTSTSAQESKSLLFESLSKDKVVRRSVLSNGDYCHVREYLNQEHTGLRIAYFIPERDASEREIKSIINKLTKQFVGKREAPLILEAVQKFKAPKSGNVDHWVIDLKSSDYAEFFIFVDLIGESIAIQIKYYK